MKHDAWGFDTETTGLSPFKDKMLATQIGRPEIGFIIDNRTVNIEPLKPFFEDKKIKKIGHNLKFDYKMMKAQTGIEVEGMRCTYLAEKVLNAGRKYRGFGLEDVVLEYLGIEMDKSAQKSFIGHKGPFTEKQLIYMEDDTKYLNPLLKAQTERMIADGVANVFLIETGCIPAFGDMELAGMILNTSGWKDILEDNIKKRAEIKAQMDEIAGGVMGYDLFGEASINYDSPEQVLKLLQHMRVRVPIINQDGSRTNVLIQNTNKQSLKAIREIKIIKLLEAYRGYSVRINTFGQPYIDAVNPDTGAIHPDLWQIGTETGRPAAGDSDINPLNIPSDNRYRHCFIGGKDEVVESDDYSGCESRILAHISGDEILRQIFLDGKDIHCEVATMMYGVPVAKDEEYAKQFGMVWDPVNKKYRKPAKSLNFGIAYGLGPKKLCEDLNGDGFPIELADSKKLYYKYCDTLHTSVSFLRSSGKLAFEQGYLANINGRRRYWRLPKPEDYPNGYRDEKYQAKKGAIEREGGNFLIQSVNADITKQAMIEIREYAKKNKVRTSFINAVYDEIVTRTHKDDSPSFHEAKLKIMRDVAERMVTSVPMLVDGFVGPYWNK